MRLAIIILTFITISFLGCSKDDNSASPAFDITDLEGIWDGYAKNTTDSISLNLTVNASGHAFSNSASGEWSIDSKGRVKGPGAYLFTRGSTLNYVNATWSLQLGTDKRKLTGTVDIDYSSLHNMGVILNKE